MNIFESLKEDVLRPIAVTLFPAIIAISPFLFLALERFPWITKLYNSHEATVVAIFIVLLIGIGFILEDIGTRAELLIDWQLKKRFNDFSTVWENYLKSRLNEPLPLAQGYIRRLLVRYKFELSLFPALSLGIIGLLTIGVMSGFGKVLNLFLLLFFMGAAWSLYEAYSSGVLMHENRRRVLNAAAPS